MSASKFITNLNLSGYEVKNVRVENLASDPQNPSPGRIYYNTTTNQLKYYDGTNWQIVDNDEGVYTVVDGKARIVAPGVEEGSRSVGEAAAITVVVLTDAQKTEIKRLTGIEFNYCDTNDAIGDNGSGCIYSDSGCTNKVAEITISKYNSDGSIEGDFFNIRTGSLTAGTYYWRLEPFASGNYSHAEGYNTIASGDNSHAEGRYTSVSGHYSHTEGERTEASGYTSHAEGGYTIASGERSHSEGSHTTASGSNSHAEGINTIASGSNSHAEGDTTIASGDNSHAEGDGNTASGIDSHAEGEDTTAEGDYSHAEGYNTEARGESSHAEGDGTISSGMNSHAEGNSTTASGDDSHAEGSGSTASGEESHAEGNNTIASGTSSHAEGEDTRATGNRSHAEGENTTASGEASHAGGYSNSSGGIIAGGFGTTATGYSDDGYILTNSSGSTATGYVENSGKIHSGSYGAIAYGYVSGVGNGDIYDSEIASLSNGSLAGGYADSEGKIISNSDGTVAIGSSQSHGRITADGIGTFALGRVHSSGKIVARGEGAFALGLSINDGEILADEEGAFAMGRVGLDGKIKAIGKGSFATGHAKRNGRIIASGLGAHAEGYADEAITTASGEGSHAEGSGTTASGSNSHAEGSSTIASNFESHAEGNNTTASGESSHSEGLYTTASGDASHAEGEGTIAASNNQHVSGKYNISDPNNIYAFLIGNGTDNSHRSNLFGVKWDSSVVKWVNGIEIELSGGIKEVTYSGLVTLKSQSKLSPGQLYRITDYVTKTSATNTQSANHAFDIIVLADSNNKLNEDAKAIQHTGDTYFSSSRLEAWEIKYDIENNTDRYNWADNVNGKGVIYYMKDEFGNECPYDFKNIQFKVRENSVVGTVNNVFYYTFSSVSGENDSTVADKSLNRLCHNNKIGINRPSLSNPILTLPFNVFRNIGSSSNLCNSNTLKDNCTYNLFGSGNSSNTLGYSSSHNNLGDNCTNNNFGKYCNYITFGFNCNYNTIGSSCNYIKFGNSQSVKSYYRYITVESGNQYIRLYCSSTTSSFRYYQNVVLKCGLNYSDAYVDITDAEVGQKNLTTYIPSNSRLISVEVPEELLDSYGIEFDTTLSSPVCSRIGSSLMHQTLPVQSLMRGCILSDNGSVVSYLPANDWTASTRDGSIGQVMVEIPGYYVKFETDGTKRRVLMSTNELTGFTYVPTAYVSAYEATLQRSTNKLASVVNLTADYRGCGNQSAWDDTYRSALGRPVTGLSRTNFRTYARNRKPGSTEWNCMTYDIQKSIYWLFAVEYATLNTQANFTSDLTAEGYHQGGLGSGVTNWSSANWNTFNGYYPFVPCGHTDSLGNGTGYVNYTASNGSDITVTSPVPRYRGIENPFGHIWQWTDGVNVRINPTTENGGNNLSEVFVCSNPANFTDSNYDNYTYVGNEARSEGYMKEAIFGATGEIVPSAVGGSTSTYFCDYHYTSIPTTTALRGLLFGGYAFNGSFAGLVFAHSNYGPSITFAYFGSRLCFIPS